MEAYTWISLPVNKLNVSSPEGDDNKSRTTLNFENSSGGIFLFDDSSITALAGT
jgi:hypothetical protein